MVAVAGGGVKQFVICLLSFVFVLFHTPVKKSNHHTKAM